MSERSGSMCEPNSARRQSKVVVRVDCRVSARQSILVRKNSIAPIVFGTGKGAGSGRVDIRRKTQNIHKKHNETPHPCSVPSM